MSEALSKPKRLEYISFLRVFSMVCILLCHYVQEIPIGFVQSTAQIFNIGVPLFFILSGFCFGLQGEIKSPSKWYVKRLRRIFIPYEIFLGLYLLVFVILGKKINWLTWGAFALGIQGNYFKIPGIEQTWFITPLLLCYLITPLVSFAAKKLKSKGTFIKIILIFCAVAFYLIICFNPSDNLFVIASPLVFFIAAYLWGMNYKASAPPKRNIFIFLCVVAVAFSFRFISRIYFDDTIIYKRLISGLTHYIAAFGIFKIFEALFFNCHSIRFIKELDSISFEVYLCHYLFLRGAIMLVKATPFILLNLVFVTIATFIVAVAIHRISTIFQKKLIK
ncbi:MAG: acyltransferase [Clostridia bacterium]|nr:acyltransferase [Clostridia bacterium]